MTRKLSVKSVSANVHIPKFGWIHVAMRRKKISSIHFSKAKAVGGEDKKLRAFVKSLERYFAGKTDALNSYKPDFAGYTPFEAKILSVLYRVKSGKTLSYKELGERAGIQRGYRAVGNVVGKNRTPILVPCHRVIRSDGSLGGFSGGLSKKVKLLKAEGVNISGCKS